MSLNHLITMLLEGKPFRNEQEFSPFPIFSIKLSLPFSSTSFNAGC